MYPLSYEPSLDEKFIFVSLYFDWRNLLDFPSGYRICDILMRIRILGSVSVHYMTDPDPSVLGMGYQDDNRNSVCLFLTVVRYLKVVGNEKIGGSGKCQMLGYGSGLWRSRFIFCLNMQFLS
jgi:hypothetical protein